MARFFLYLSLLEEAWAIDCLEDRNRSQAERRRRRRRLHRQHQQDSHESKFRDLESYHGHSHGDQDHVHLYRLSKDLLESLHNEITPLLRKPRRLDGLSTRLKLMCALSFLANGTYQKNVGEKVNTHLSQPSVSRSIREFVEALNDPTIVQKYIRFPHNEEERLALKERFYEMFNIPAVIGCVSGAFVAIVRPTEHDGQYCCSKSNHAINVQLITDADLNIIGVDAKYGGATAKDFIFDNGPIKTHLKELVNAEETVHLLGDSDYTLRPYLMTPVPNAEEDTPEDNYNKMHAAALNTVKRTIRLLKARFRCLLVHKALHYHPEMASKIVIACCVLHNICNKAGLPAPILSKYDDEKEASFRGLGRRGRDNDGDIGMRPIHDDVDIGMRPTHDDGDIGMRLIHDDSDTGMVSDIAELQVEYYRQELIKNVWQACHIYTSGEETDYSSGEAD